MPTERQLTKHSMHLSGVHCIIALHHIAIGAVCKLKCSLKLQLTQGEVLVVVLSRAHGTSAEVADKDRIILIVQLREVITNVVQPVLVDTEVQVGSVDMRHDVGRVALHQIGNDVLVKQATCKWCTL